MSIEATAVINTTGITSLSLVSTEVDAGIFQLSKGEKQKRMTKSENSRYWSSSCRYPNEIFQLISFNRG